ncbi:phosphoribosyltransferase family protein [Haladaptatus sp. DYSN1]|uniref:phosphoribosyltransferase family protein n=1 Tax=unclassified Haladaptatus TaxID=2622732 RepID=UPI002404992D|nr:phosphoribosyltransferase family protein [Haladaptatus sp. DYSN1]
MEWPDIVAQIDTGTGGRYHTGNLATDPDTFDAVVTDLAAPFSAESVDAVAGIDALGFLFGAAVARELGVGFCPIRKGGKLPIASENRLTETVVGYTGTEKTLELDRTSVSNGARVLVVDDWTETGSQLAAAVALVSAAGGNVVGIAVLGADERETVLQLDEDYGVHALHWE